MALALSPGQQIYKFELQRMLGQGNFGQVWLAKDTHVDREYAVKVIESSIATLATELTEARIGAKVDHPNLVNVHYAEVLNDGSLHVVFIAMDYHKHGSIVNRLNAAGFIPLPIAIACICDVLKGLEYLHDRGLYHGDIKPSNILQKDAKTAMLTDYGIACQSPDGKAVPMKDVYLLHKAPDTIATEKINEQTDVYQAGLTAFRILNRNGVLRDKYKQYGRDKYLELVSKGNLIKPTDYAPFVPAGVRRIINKAIHPDPEIRFRSAREFRKSLEAQVYPGYWDINADGDLEGVIDGNTFMFERRATKTGKYELVALKKNLASQRVTHVTAHCQKTDTPKDLERKEADFMQAVIKGEC